MAEGMNSTCKAFIAQQLAINEQRSQRFCDLFDQLVFEGRMGTPMQQQIVRAKRGLITPADALPTLQAETNSTEVDETSNDWTARSL